MACTDSGVVCSLLRQINSPEDTPSSRRIENEFRQEIKEAVRKTRSLKTNEDAPSRLVSGEKSQTFERHVVPRTPIIERLDQKNAMWRVNTAASLINFEVSAYLSIAQRYNANDFQVRLDRFKTSVFPV
jgi:hypothetical protein